MLGKITNFFSEYRQLALVILLSVVALILDVVGQDQVAHIILTITAAISVIPLTWGMIQDLRAGTYGVDILAATAIITSLLMGEYWAGIIIVLMLTGGETLEDYAQARARTELNALLDRAPKKAHVLRGRKTVDVLVSKVKAGDKILIKAGEVVPVDAVILEGSASFDESSLTGESAPASKTVNDELLSGSVNVDGLITARALRAAADSQYEQIIQLVKGAASGKSPLVRLADRYSVPFTILSFSIAIGSWVVSGEALRFLQVLVVATPCPLIFGAPVALVSGMSRAAKRGIIFKSGAVLERLAAVKTIGFDKTGTLTLGKPIVKKVKHYGSYNERDVLTLAASLEQNSNHSVASAITQHAKEKGIKLAKVKNLREIPGKGVTGTFGGYEIVAGQPSFLKDIGVTFPTDVKTDQAQTTVFIGAGDTLAGIIILEDEVRKESKKTLAHFRLLGINQFLMVTGDHAEVAKNVASKVGISEYYAQCLPADKLRIIEQVENRPVAFIGDGVNDAPVLAASDTGIALGARGSAAASESADVVIMEDDLERAAIATAISKRTLFIAKQSIWIGIVISVGLMAAYSTGRFSPISGALLQELVDVVVIFNALRAHGNGN